MRKLILVAIVLAGLIPLFSHESYGQQVIATFEKDPRKDSLAKKPVIYPVVLGNSELSGGTISKQIFDSLLRQGIKPVDTEAKVAGFLFNYKERNIYEDSVGNLIPVTDLLMEYCPGDTLTPTISSSIYFRTKRGDTAFFDDIRVIWPDGKEGRGKGMKFILQ